MSDQRFRQCAALAAATTALAAACAVRPNPVLALGIAAGGLWSLANLWCLARMLAAWLGARARRRAVGWLLVKLILLYPAALALLSADPRLSPGFGLGFGIALVVIVAGVARAARQPAALPTHGR
jgi:hypothetical protein